MQLAQQYANFRARPLSADQELLEHEIRVELMAIQTKYSETQVRWEPWKAMAAAAGAGAGIMAALIGIITLVLHAMGV